MKRNNLAEKLVINGVTSNWLDILCLFLLSLIAVILGTVSPLIYRTLIDSAIPSRNYITIIKYISIIISLPLGQFIASFFKERIVYFFSNKICESLREKAFSAALNLTITKFNEIGYQKIQSVITRDTGRICDVFIAGNIMTIATSSLQLIAVLVVLLQLQWHLAAACLIIIPIILLILKSQRVKIEKMESLLGDLLWRCDMFLTGVLLGIKTVKSFNAQDNERFEFKLWLKENKKTGWEIKSSHQLVRTILPNTAQQIVLGIVLTISAIFVIKDDVSIGTLVAVISYVPILMSSINAILGINIGYASIKNSITNLNDLLSAEQEDNTQVSIQKDIFISVRDLKFSYEREGFELNIPEFNINNGEVVAIVGESGSGKSSIIDLLCKFYSPTSGKILIFDKDINEISHYNLRSVVKPLLQDSYIWNKTVRENIIYPNKNINWEKYKHAISCAALEEFIEALPEKDETTIGAFGYDVSGGERQRIALARAIYSDSQLLVLDEPTAALDSLTAQIVLDNLVAEKQRGRTMVIITHNISQAMLADNIIVIEGGTVLDYGKPDYLLQNSVKFKAFYDAHIGSVHN